MLVLHLAPLLGSKFPENRVWLPERLVFLGMKFSNQFFEHYFSLAKSLSSKTLNELAVGRFRFHGLSLYNDFLNKKASGKNCFFIFPFPKVTFSGS